MGGGNTTNSVRYADTPSPSGGGGDAPIYRGVNESHPGYNDALKGEAKPRGGSATPEQHNNGDTKSEFTSWSTTKKTAEKWALFGGGKKGVVLETTTAGKQMVESPDNYIEDEVLVRGPVTGARPVIVLPGILAVLTVLDLIVGSIADAHRQQQNNERVCPMPMGCDTY